MTEEGSKPKSIDASCFITYSDVGLLILEDRVDYLHIILGGSQLKWIVARGFIDMYFEVQVDLLSATHVNEFVAIFKLDGIVEGSLELG